MLLLRHFHSNALIFFKFLSTNLKKIEVEDVPVIYLMKLIH